ncbi:hypothetical protein BDA96_04G270500 [Sorghum bicolor]|uniref:Uncharacterized protein n=2 Tax=Sorghum bicolor TaxID=4558 RepID=A0A921R5F5_SORBI|nr:hypothetical protein BDA96_04G270500 [Sorghum bicolor]KAG0534329.1 hypothetical protein BDA96_04G270500 [Sorghum bicolor]KXG30843.1 hypothetical protein SORBI_3004G253700 [Sorghum bicolor]
MGRNRQKSSSSAAAPKSLHAHDTESAATQNCEFSLSPPTPRSNPPTRTPPKSAMVARASGCRLLGLVLSGVASTRDGSGAAVEALFGVTCACAEAASNSPFHGARVRGGCRHVRHLVAVGLGEGGERAGPPPLQALQ